ncbi:hypothetical protein [Methyloceanibacter superfactus]|uniref:hypothetical protein n=1 Tax=Methyloceanibacter superfactus TaxID=1774969 RepID=UPI00195E973D|nr:hypothetical protein [Methyloceanibacter superfactus]
MKQIRVALAGLCLPVFLLTAGSAAAADSGYSVQYYDVAPGDHPHDVAPARTAPSGTRASTKACLDGSIPRRAR